MDKKEAALKMINSQVVSCHREWHRHCSNLSREILQGDIDNFMNFQAVRETMFVGNAEYTWEEFKEMEEEGVDLSELDDCDKFSSAYQHPLWGTTGNTIHHRYHLYLFEKMTNTKIADMNAILELGGGYGNMARLVHKMGFTGDYYIKDLPEFEVLQEYYLDHHDISVGWEPDLSAKYDLFIATWSLSEIPMPNRGPYSHIDADYFLIAFGPEYGGIDNKEYFMRLSKTYDDTNWYILKTPHLDNQFYMFGEPA